MTTSLNKVMIIGNLGKEPDLRFLPDGTPTTKFSVACGRDWKAANGELKSETEWFNVVTWRKTAENCGKYCYKGQRVYVEGRLQTRKWTSPEGVEKKIVEIVAHTVLFLSKPKPGTPSEMLGDEEAPAVTADDEEVAF